MRSPMASDRCVIDSSVFVAFYREVDSLHVDALAIMREIADATLVVHPYVIQETTTVLAYAVGLPLAKQFLIDIGASPNVFIPPVDMQREIQSFKNVKVKISFTDSALVALAKDLGARLITFDMQMLSLARKS